jgi:hypothetical protein
MERQFVSANKRELERLKKVANSLSVGELKLVIYKEGWTIAVVLAHLAFWDERRRVMLKIWKQKGVAQSPYFEDIFNDALLPLLLAIPPRKAADLAIITAEALDKELEKLPAVMIKAIEALKEPNALNRAIHRKMHLDEIEAFLKTKRIS